MSWHACTLGEVVKLQRGHDLPERIRVAGSVPVVSSSGVTGWHNVAKADPPGVVTGRYGTIGEVFFIEEPYWPLNTALYVVDFKNNDPRFVSYLLRNTLRNYQTEKAAVPGVDRNVLHQLPVKSANRPTQQRVVEFLAAYDDLIENNQKRIALLEEAARLLYREWFVHLRFPGHEHVKVVDGVPEGWERRPFAACATFQSGGTPSKANGAFWEGDVPWISSGELTSMRINSSTQHVTDEAVRAGSRYAEVGTILGVVRGMSLAKEFRLGVVGARVCFNQDLKAFVPDRGIESLYLFHAIDEQRERIRQSAGEASHGTKKLETVVLEALPVPVPPQAVRQHFVEYAAPIHRQMDVLVEQNSRLTQGRDLLLPRLMSGGIAV